MRGARATMVDPNTSSLLNQASCRYMAACTKACLVTLQGLSRFVLRAYIVTAFGCGLHAVTILI